MNTELLQYIEYQIVNGGIGIVEFEPAPVITNFDDMIAWITGALKGAGIVSKKRLKYFWSSLNSEIINKTRNYYLNESDFIRLKFKIVNANNPAFTPYAIIAGVNTFSDTNLKLGEFYYCTAEEFEVIKASML